MTNYNKALKEGRIEIQEIVWKHNPLEPINETLVKFLSSFAEKIREATKRDMENKSVENKEE